MTESVLGVFAIVELFGHNKIAGYVSEEMVVGVPMLQVAVPGSVNGAPFIRYYGAKTIFSITPVSEQAVRQFVEFYEPAQSPVYVPDEPMLIPSGTLDDDDDEAIETKAEFGFVDEMPF
jgi:hypothetical protein